jgi:hypothetical protein
MRSWARDMIFVMFSLLSSVHSGPRDTADGKNIVLLGIAVVTMGVAGERVGGLGGICIKITKH